MNKISAFAFRRPFLYGFLLVITLAIVTAVMYPIHFLFPETVEGIKLADSIVKVIIFLLFFALQYAMGWMSVTGFASLPKAKDWTWIILILVYKILVEAFAFTGDVQLFLPQSSLGWIEVAYSFATGLLEETLFRALIFYPMFVAWGSTRAGLIRSAIFSGMYFSLTHLFNLMVNPVGAVVAQAIILTIPGILYAAILLKTRSIYPAIIIHSLTNLFVNVKIIEQMPDFTESFSQWLIYGAFSIPIIFISLYILIKLPLAEPPQRSIMIDSEVE